MNEIKYRAWDTVSQKMIYWESIVKYRMFHDLMDDSNVLMMPFTGMIDKNGIEIYDKDIVTVMLIADDGTEFYDRVGLVRYCEFEWEIEMNDGNWPVASWSVVEDCEVTANIFESDDFINSIFPQMGKSE